MKAWSASGNRWWQESRLEVEGAEWSQQQRVRLAQACIVSRPGERPRLKATIAAFINLWKKLGG